MQKGIRVLIIDEYFQDWQSIFDSQFNTCFIVSSVVRSYVAALKKINTLDYDIAIIEPDFGGNNRGVELGRRIKNEFYRPYIFVATTNSEYVLYNAIEAKPSAFMSMPICTHALIITLQSVMEHYRYKQGYSNLDDRRAHFFVKSGDKYKKVDWEDVVYMRSEKNYTCIFNAVDQKEYLIRSTLIRTLHEIIPNNMLGDFVQINRAEAVKLDHIIEYSGDELKTMFNTMHVTEMYGRQLKAMILFLT